MRSSNWKLCDDYSPKQIALFQSVVSLLEDGVSAANMKVSDIAVRAGVGKGTTYEYFSSKEEMIVRAIFYDIQIKMTELEGRIRLASGFENSYYTILEWIDENLQAKHVLYQILGMNSMDCQLSSEICNMIQIHKEGLGHIRESLVGLTDMAEQEGLISPQVPASFRNLSFISSILSYVSYLKMQNSITDVTKQQIKEFLYNSMIRALQA